MEIKGNNPLANLDASVQRLDYQQQQQQRTQGAVQEASKLSSDRLELSTRSREIQHLDRMIQSAPEIRQNKVEQLRSAVENGTYNIRAEMIADKILGGNRIDEVF